MKLRRMLGTGLERAKPKLAPFWRSRLAISTVVSNLDGVLSVLDFDRRDDPRPCRRAQKEERPVQGLLPSTTFSGTRNRSARTRGRGHRVLPGGAVPIRPGPEASRRSSPYPTPVSRNGSWPSCARFAASSPACPRRIWPTFSPTRPNIDDWPVRPTGSRSPLRFSVGRSCRPSASHPGSIPSMAISRRAGLAALAAPALLALRWPRRLAFGPTSAPDRRSWPPPPWTDAGYSAAVLDARGRTIFTARLASRGHGDYPRRFRRRADGRWCSPAETGPGTIAVASTEGGPRRDRLAPTGRGPCLPARGKP